MWVVSNKNIQMAEGDYGIALYFRLNGVVPSASDTFEFKFKTALNGTTLLTKTLTGISDNEFELSLTAADTALLPTGRYVYSLDWYRSGTFMCNLVLAGTLIVEDKA